MIVVGNTMLYGETPIYINKAMLVVLEQIEQGYIGYVKDGNVQKDIDKLRRYYKKHQNDEEVVNVPTTVEFDVNGDVVSISISIEQFITIAIQRMREHTEHTYVKNLLRLLTMDLNYSIETKDL